MNRENEAFLTVLSAVFQKVKNDLGDVDVPWLCVEASRQHLLPLMLVGCEKLGLDVSEKWKRQAAGMVADQMVRSTVFMDLYQKMVSKDLHPIVVKGIICRHTYGKYGDYRPSSDEDIYVHKDELLQVASFLKKEGYTSDQWELLDYPEAIDEFSFDSSDGHLHLEIHTGWFGNIGKRSDVFNAVFKDVDKHLITLEIDGMTYTTLSHTMHYLYLFFHLAKHFSGSGVGLRQALDLVLYAKMYGNEIDFAFVEETVSDYGMERLYEDVISLARHIVYGEKINHAVEELVEDSLSSGIYGNDTEAHRRSGVFLIGEGQKNGFMRKIYVLFPPYRKMKLGYPYLLKKPYLLPVSWFHRFYRIWQEYGGKDMVVASYGIARRRTRLMKRYGFIDE